MERRITLSLAAILAAVALRGVPPGAEPSDTPTNDIAAAPADPVSFWIEAEQFPGLVHHPNWNIAPGQGWYGKDHRHASGRAFVVCDEQSPNARICMPLERACPPGPYLVVPTLVLMRFTPGREGGYGRDNGNRLRIELGNLKPDGEFAPVASKEYINLYGSGYGDHGEFEIVERVDAKGKKVVDMKKKLPILDARESWNAIRLTAVRVVAAGIGDLPEHPLATLCVDKIGITNMPGTKTRSSHSGRCWYALPEVAKPGGESPASGATAAPTTPVPVVVRPPLPAPAGNLIPNGSFEAGARPLWLPTMTGQLGNRFDDEDIVEDKAAPHGQKVAVLQPFLVEGLPLRTDRELDLFATSPEKSKLTMAQDISHTPFPVSPGRHRLTLWARGSRPGLQLAVVGLVQARFDLAAEWAAYQADVVFPAPKENAPPDRKDIQLSFTTKNAQDRVFLDAVSLEKVAEDDTAQTGPASQPRPFRAGDGIEAHVTTRQYLATYYSSKPIVLHATAVNTTDKETTLTIEWVLYDVTGIRWEDGKTPVRVGARSVAAASIPLKGRHLGSYGLSYRIPELPSQRPAVTCFSVVPDPTQVKGKKPFIGAYAMSLEAEARALAFYGWDWKTDLNDRYQRGGYGSSLDPETGELKWETYRQLNAIWAKYGIEWVGEIIPSEKPAYDPGVPGTKAAAHADLLWYSHDVWDKVVENVVRHYKGMCKYWILADEMEYGHHEQDSAAYCAIGSAAARRADPGIKVLFSITPDGFRNVTSLLGTPRWTDVLAGSYFGMGKWGYRKSRQVMQAHQLPAWHIGVGSGGPMEEESFDEYGLPTAQARVQLPRRLSWWAMDFSLQSAISEPDRYCPYVVKYAGLYTDPYNHFGPDGRLKTNGIIYTITCQHLRDARRGDLIVPERASCMEACFFTRSDGTWAAVSLLPPAFEKQVTLNLPPNEVEVLDYYLRPVPVTPAPGGKATTFTLKRDFMLYLHGRQELVDAVTNMQATDSLDIRHLVVKTPPGYDYICALKNNTARALSGTITAPRGIVEPSAPAAQPISLAPGAESLVRYPLRPAFASARPLAYYPVQAQITLEQTTLSETRDVREEEKFQKEGTVFDFGAEVWTHYARPITPETPIGLDGRVDEYRTSQVGAWTYITWEMGGSYQQSQGRRGVEACQSPDDLRVTTWVRYDKNTLVLAGEVYDDRMVFGPDAADARLPGDRVIYTFGADVLKDVLRTTLSDRHVQVVIGPEIAYHRATLLRSGQVIGKIPLHFQFHPGQWTFEVAIPAKTLGVESLEAGQTYSFEIECIDSDSEDRRLETEVAWSGARYVSGDPRGHGQLLLH